MGLTQLSEKCQKCPFVDICENKRMEALAYLPEPMTAEQFYAGFKVAGQTDTVIRCENIKRYIDKEKGEKL